MRASAILSVVLALALATTASGSQSFAGTDVPTPGQQAFTLTSAILGDRFEVIVAAPRGVAPAPGQRFPLLVVTDGYRTLAPAVDAMESLLAQQVIEPMYLVSIGVPFAAGDSTWAMRRVYEFSPPAWPRTDAFGQMVEAAVCRRYGSAPGRCTGGAPEFLSVLATELIPQLARRFPIDTTKLGLFGVSAGGFFASWAMFAPTSPFRTYIISSPAMAYGDGDIYRREAAWGRDHKDLPARVYVSSGSLEQDDPFLEGVGQIVSGHARFVAALRGRNYPSLHLVTEVLPGLGHGDATGTSLVRAMRTLYAKPPTAAPK
jgi:predicted alpha/beta superfamily hydrolase